MQHCMREAQPGSACVAASDASKSACHDSVSAEKEEHIWPEDTGAGEEDAGPMTALDDSGAAARNAAEPDGASAGPVMDGMQRLSLAAWPPQQRTPTSQPQRSPAARALT